MQATLLGNVQNSEIQKFYSKNNVDIFINFSNSEGIPVSIMEALSYGIPVVATDVGGTSEIVTSSVGALIHSNANTEELSRVIENVIRRFSTNDAQKIHDIWKNKYSALTNYNTFIRSLERQYV